ncbi:MAG: MarR family transcriptional regulator [Spirochaetes bacterium]|nr:MarR family transcriptional regulator [Spirochaetota bacterium]MBU1080511.1 MarR family transcriptional regulator [Spirochaetota bacterium]
MRTKHLEGGAAIGLSPLGRLAIAIGRRSVHDFMEFGRERGLSLSQLSALQALYHRGPLAVGELGRFAPGGRSALTQLADGLVGAGLATRSEAEDDRRRKIVALTPEGEALVRDGIARRTAWAEDAAKGLDPETLRAAARLADRLDELEA